MKRRFKPMLDGCFYLIWVPLSLMMIILTIISVSYLAALIIMAITDIFVFYFLFSTLSAYVELREDTMLVKFGFIIKREIAYSRIREISKERKFYSQSMLSIKNSIEHVNIKYNRFDIISVSVVTNDELISELERRISSLK